MANIDTLVDDIRSLFEKGHVADAKNAEELGQQIAKMVVRRLKEAGEPEREFSLRMSNIGKEDRQLWMDAHHKGEPEKLPAEARIKFMFGDILEHLLIFLAKEAGHDVQNQQEEVEVEGIPGHLDARIDGVVVDAKSASSIAFRKFEDGSLPRKDDFGYCWQLAGYCHAKQAEGAFLVIDKTLGKICLLKMEAPTLALYDVPERISHLKAVIASSVIPDKCFIAVPDGKSGNMKLDTGCSYCRHKHECWEGLRTFIYSTGPRFLTEVKRLPDVPEVQQAQEEEN